MSYPKQITVGLCCSCLSLEEAARRGKPGRVLPNAVASYSGRRFVQHAINRATLLLIFISDMRVFENVYPTIAKPLSTVTDIIRECPSAKANWFLVRNTVIRYIHKFQYFLLRTNKEALK